MKKYPFFSFHHPHPSFQIPAYMSPSLLSDRSPGFSLLKSAHLISKAFTLKFPGDLYQIRTSALEALLEKNNP